MQKHYRLRVSKSKVGRLQISTEYEKDIMNRRFDHGRHSSVPDETN